MCLLNEIAPFLPSGDFGRPSNLTNEYTSCYLVLAATYTVIALTFDNSRSTVGDVINEVIPILRRLCVPNVEGPNVEVWRNLAGH